MQQVSILQSKMQLMQVGLALLMHAAGFYILVLPKPQKAHNEICQIALAVIRASTNFKVGVSYKGEIIPERGHCLTKGGGGGDGGDLDLSYTSSVLIQD